jgi:hypothetical protein
MHTFSCLEEMFVLQNEFRNANLTEKWKSKKEKNESKKGIEIKGQKQKLQH